MDKPMDIGLPDKMEIVRRSNGIEIVRRWFGPQVIFMTLFAVAWDVFLVFWYSMAGGSGNLMMLLFPLIHVAVGIGITYYVVAGWLNRTTISVTRGMLAIRHGPVPWFGNLEIPAAGLKQLYVRDEVRHTKNGSTTYYDVMAITRRDRSIRLVRWLTEADQALYIEQEIEKYLGIEDQPVKGAFG